MVQSPEIIGDSAQLVIPQVVVIAELASPNLLDGRLHRLHISLYAQAGSDGYVFTGEKGGPLAPHVLQKEWARAREAVGVAHLHLHDLRHLAGTLAATTGAGTKELMYRLGHASPQAALRYQHATKARDVAIADAMDALITAGTASTTLVGTSGTHP